MSTRLLAFALCMTLAAPVSLRAEGRWDDNPLIPLSIFAGVCFVMYKGIMVYERSRAHSCAIDLIATTKSDNFLNTSDIVALAQKQYGDTPYPLISAYTHLTDMSNRLQKSCAKLQQEAMRSAYTDCVDLHMQTQALIQKITTLLPRLEGQEQFKDQFDRYMLSTVPGMMQSINDLKETINTHHCHCH